MLVTLNKTKHETARVMVEVHEMKLLIINQTPEEYAALKAKEDAEHGRVEFTTECVHIEVESVKEV